MLLVPVGLVANEKRPAAEEVWQGMIQGVAVDPESQKLLRKLMNCDAVELVRLDKAPQANGRPAQTKTKAAIYLGVYLNAGKPGEKDLPGGHMGPASFVGFEVPPTRKWMQNAGPWDALVIAANEYLHRKRKGYQLHKGVFFELDQLAPEEKDASLRGLYLQKQIEGFLAKYPK
jgi:hypothetical protein